MSFAAWGFGTLGGVCSLGVRIFGLRLGVRNFGSTVFWLAGYLGSAHLDHRISVSLCGCLLWVVWFFGFSLGSHGTLVAVSASFMMPLRDSDIPMNVPFTFSNKQPLALDQHSRRQSADPLARHPCPLGHTTTHLTTLPWLTQPAAPDMEELRDLAKIGELRGAA